MFGVRDLVWALLICAGATLLFQCRPAWSARKALERDANEAFAQAFRGRRGLDGQVIAPPGAGAHVDSMAGPITHRSFEIVADRISWSGNKSELVARHVVELAGEPSRKVEAHVKLEKRSGRWAYTLFEVRDGAPLTDPDTGNPWLRAMR